MLADIGIEKLLLILAIVLIFFGPRRLPELGATLGKGIRDFKRSLHGVDDDAVAPVAPVAPPVATTPRDAAPVPHASTADPKRLLS